MTEILVKLVGVNKIYGNGVKHHVLHDINLSINHGTYTAIIGPSGSGKSTLLNLIGTLDRPTSGRIIIDGERVENWSKRRAASYRNAELGFIFQHHHLLPEFTVFENIMMPAKILGFRESRRTKPYAIELLDRIGLANHRDKRPSEISGGQQQRAAIARALVNKPKLLLADEPGASLDTNLTSEIYELMADLNNELETTILLITHEKQIRSYVDHTIELWDGQIRHHIENK